MLNSLFFLLKSVAELDQIKLMDVLKENNHQNLILTSRELGSLQEVVEILQPFAKARITQHLVVLFHVLFH